MNTPILDTTRSRVGRGLRPEKLSRRVLRDLVRRIVNHDLAEGPPTELEISETYEVSRTVAREVIGQLESLGLIDVRHGKRMGIRSSDEWNYLDPLVLEAIEDHGELGRLLSELHELRVLVEPPVAERAALSASDAEIARMRSLATSMGESLELPDRYLELDVQFHAALFTAVKNRLLGQVFDSVGGLLRVSRQASNLIPGALTRATSDHWRIVNAIAESDPQRARLAMEEHLAWLPAAWEPSGGRPTLPTSESGHD